MKRKRSEVESHDIRRRMTRGLALPTANTGSPHQVPDISESFPWILKRSLAFPLDEI